MAVRSMRRTGRAASTKHHTASYPKNLGPYSGMAQDGPARKQRASALAEEILTRGCSFVEKGVWDDAEKEFRKAIKMTPDYPEAYNNLGLCMLYDGRASEAVEALQEAVRRLPNWFCAEANLALAYQQLEHHNEAVSYFRQSLHHNTRQPQVSLSLGDSLNALGLADEAIEAYNHALEQVPHYALAYSRAGIIYARKGKIAEAEQTLARAVELDPSNSEAYAVLGTIAARRGHIRQAKDLFENISGTPVPSAERGAQRIALFENAARKGLEEWTAMQPPPKPLAMCYYDVALALLAVGDESEAQIMFQQAAQCDPKWVAPQVFLAFGAALRGDALTARSTFELAAELDDSIGVIPEQLGYVALGMGLTKEAEVFFKRAEELGRTLSPEITPSDAQ